MCGRVTLDLDIQLLKEILEGSYDVKQMSFEDYEKRYNIGPGQQVLSIINDGESNRSGYMKWGFIPPFADDPKVGNKLINIRSETADSKPSFKDSFIHKRCVIIANSFYEWDSKSGSRIPYRIIIKDQPIMPLAGLWSKYTTGDGRSLFTCSVITIKANDAIKYIHHRMPVILTPSSFQTWLNPRIQDPTVLKPILTTYDDQQLSMYPVSNLVNNIKLDTKECILPR